MLGSEAAEAIVAQAQIGDAAANVAAAHQQVEADFRNKVNEIEQAREAAEQRQREREA